MIAIEPTGEGKLVIIAEDQPEYLPLPAKFITYDNGSLEVHTEWSLTSDERIAIMSGVNIHLYIMTFGGPINPIRLEVDVGL